METQLYIIKRKHQLTLMEKEMAPAPVLSPGKSHGWRSLGRLQSMGSQRVGHDRATSLTLDKI